MALSVITIYMASILPAGCINMLLSPFPWAQGTFREKRRTRNTAANVIKNLNINGANKKNKCERWKAAGFMVVIRNFLVGTQRQHTKVGHDFWGISLAQPFSRHDAVINFPNPQPERGAGL